jgi:hypothetical protein
MSYATIIFQDRAGVNVDLKGFANGPNSYWVRNVEVENCLTATAIKNPSHDHNFQSRAEADVDKVGYGGSGTIWVRELEVRFFIIVNHTLTDFV